MNNTPPSSPRHKKKDAFPVAVDGQWTADPAAVWAVADLQKSGILPATAEAAKVGYTASGRKIRSLLNRSDWSTGGTALIFQYFGLDGKALGYNRLKPEKPRTETRDAKTRVIKYDAPI